ncbi:hypothetical protein Q2T40_00565 [Winogradskyella maritima]|nr:hypothetical protein [Winogradskyella maritima]
MRQLTSIAACLILLFTVSCKETKKEEKANAEAEVESSTEQYRLVQDSVKVSFTAYKNTEKLPVGGQFKEIKITNSNGGQRH